VSKTPESNRDVIHAYRKRAKRYDLNVRLFDLFSVFGFSIEAWRSEAIRAIKVQRGDTVVDIGCGTGLNFPLLQETIGPEGRIIAVDLSDAMLDQARWRVAEQGWTNVELVQDDAARFQFPAHVGGIVSTLALTLVPECGRVIDHASAALAPDRRLVVLDMAWPRWMPVWFRHVLFFLRSYGVTGDVIRRRPWQTVYQTMEQQLVNVTRKEFWMGFFYLATGRSRL
jgi:demethylmenaquinone methyltransferase/2-methoxy-6-polyprenyl-1,4-benzoquinol methylase